MNKGTTKTKKIKVIGVTIIIIAIICELLLRIVGLPLMYCAPISVKHIKNATAVFDTHSFCEGGYILDMDGFLYVLHGNGILYIYRYTGRSYNHENILDPGYMNIIEWAKIRKVSLKDYCELMKYFRKIPEKTYPGYKYPDTNIVGETPPCTVAIYKSKQLAERDVSDPMQTEEVNSEDFYEILHIMEKYNEFEDIFSDIVGDAEYVWLRTDDGWKKINREEYYNKIEEYYKVRKDSDLKEYDYMLQIFG